MDAGCSASVETEIDGVQSAVLEAMAQEHRVLQARAKTSRHATLVPARVPSAAAAAELKTVEVTFRAITCYRIVSRVPGVHSPVINNRSPVDG